MNVNHYCRLEKDSKGRPTFLKNICRDRPVDYSSEKSKKDIGCRNTAIKTYQYIWDNVFGNGPSKICGRQPLKILFGPFLTIPQEHWSTWSSQYHKILSVVSYILFHFQSRWFWYISRFNIKVKTKNFPRDLKGVLVKNYSYWNKKIFTNLPIKRVAKNLNKCLRSIYKVVLYHIYFHKMELHGKPGNDLGI